MLRELYVENLAVIERAVVQFQQGFTVFTGETGAGKSILIDAINLVLGQRSNKEIVRTGAEKAVVSAVFSDLRPETEEKIKAFGYDLEGGELLISREISADGKSTARLMGRPVTAGILRDLSAQLITIHGQHDNQILLSAENHIDILDSFAGIQDVLRDYQKEYGVYTQLKNQYRKLSMDEQEKARRIDLLSYQVEEIAAAQLQPGEEEQIDQQLSAMRNAAKISAALSLAYEALSGGEESGYDLVNTASSSLEEVSEYHPQLTQIGEQLDGIRSEIEDAAGRISDFLEKYEFDGQLLESLEQRHEEIYGLKRKYGSTVEEILEFYDSAEKELKSIQMSEQMQEELAAKLQNQKKTVMEKGKQLSALRMKAGKQFAEQVAQQLTFLDMPNVSLQVMQEKGKFGAKGCDHIEFLFSTNRGESPKSIGKIASGGELSRIMLAMKTVLAEKDIIDTLIFDEIDTGVSGRSAQKIGLKLKEAAGSRQVLCVTHSAQIAALAQNHFLIRKETSGQRTYTSVTPLGIEERIGEVARIMATDTITDLMLQNAREMIENGLK